jgi:hypothetical protein
MSHEEDMRYANPIMVRNVERSRCGWNDNIVVCRAVTITHAGQVKG